MENTTKAGNISLPKAKALKITILSIFAFIICRGPLMGESFPLAISFIAYMLSRSAANIYLLLPAAAGLLPYINGGIDPWADLIAMCVCGIFFTAARRMKFEMWHRAVIAAAIGIVCVSIYRLATGTVYKTGAEQLILEGFLIFSGVFVLKVFFICMERGTRCVSSSVDDVGFRAASLLLIALMGLNGVGASSLAWVVVIFVVLWLLIDMDLAAALLALAAGGGMTALMEQSHWGLMVTLFMALAAASILKKYGTIPVIMIFAAVCWALGFVESGVVLGIDDRYLFISVALFPMLRWKFGAGMARLIKSLTGSRVQGQKMESDYIESVFREKLTEINDLSELYATYLDSRSILADQFSISGQLLEDAAWQLSRSGRKTARNIHEKVGVNVAISQCAATGAINGDCCGWQEIGGSKIALVVSDGMGKGKKAASESLMVTKTILSLLKAGASVDITLKTINTIMLMKDDEDSYATVDLVIIDKSAAKAKFYKIGAAPTLIRRKESVEEVKLSAVPLGIVNGLKIRYVETTLKKDDWIIMMSDGVSDGGIQRAGMTGGDGGGEFLQKLRTAAANVRSQDPQTMGDLLLNQAADSYIGKERDDMTVMVAKVV